MRIYVITINKEVCVCVWGGGGGGGIYHELVVSFEKKLEMYMIFNPVILS